MVARVRLEGFDAFQKAVEENRGKNLFAFFSGSPGDDGKSWCPDCVTAEPVVDRNLKHADADAVFLHCLVGDRAYWKDMNNRFRKDPQLRLTSVPTLLRLGKPQQLKEEQCANDDLVKMLFTDSY